MNKKILSLLVFFFLLGSAGLAKISSYGTITGAAVVNKAIRWDIIETGSDVNTTATNDESYYLETTYQGETKWVKIKILNDADVPIKTNINISSSYGDDMKLSLWDESKASSIQNPIEVPVLDMYIWIKHEFNSSAAIGAYSFKIDIEPA